MYLLFVFVCTCLCCLPLIVKTVYVRGCVCALNVHICIYLNSYIHASSGASLIKSLNFRYRGY